MKEKQTSIPRFILTIVILPKSTYDTISSSQSLTKMSSNTFSAKIKPPGSGPKSRLRRHSASYAGTMIDGRLIPDVGGFSSPEHLELHSSNAQFNTIVALFIREIADKHDEVGMLSSPLRNVQCRGILPGLINVHQLLHRTAYHHDTRCQCRG